MIRAGRTRLPLFYFKDSFEIVLFCGSQIHNKSLDKAKKKILFPENGWVGLRSEYLVDKMMKGFHFLLYSNLF